MAHNFPKIIWQTHNYRQEWLPEYLSNVAATWVNLNPGWEYRYVNQVEREEVVSKYPEIYEAYRYLLPMLQADVWRYIVTYEYGGCYADMDSLCVMPLDYMLEGIADDIEIVVVPENKGIGNNANFIIKPQSSVMKNIIDQMAASPRTSAIPTHPMFNENVYQYKNTSKTFNAASHSKDYKHSFPLKKVNIDYYGHNLNYVDFCKEKGLPLRLPTDMGRI